MTAAVLVAGFLTSGALASIVSYTNFDAWSSASATPVTSIFFTEIDFEPGGPTVVNDQYAALGVHFADHFLAESSQLYPSDGRGLAASQNFIGTITVDFSEPRTSVAADFIGAMRINLFFGDTLIGTSINPPTWATFIGVVAEQPFDRIVLEDYAGSAPLFDNLYFGAPIPAPAGLSVLGLGLGAFRRRRRGR